LGTAWKPWCGWRAVLSILTLRVVRAGSYVQVLGIIAMIPVPIHTAIPSVLVIEVLQLLVLLLWSRSLGIHKQATQVLRDHESKAAHLM